MQSSSSYASALSRRQHRHAHLRKHSGFTWCPADRWWDNRAPYVRDCLTAFSTPGTCIIATASSSVSVGHRQVIKLDLADKVQKFGSMPTLGAPLLSASITQAFHCCRSTVLGSEFRCCCRLLWVPPIVQQQHCHVVPVECSRPVE